MSQHPQRLPRFIPVELPGGRTIHVNPERVLYVEEHRDQAGRLFCSLVFGPPKEGGSYPWKVETAMTAADVVSLFEGPDVSDDE